MMNATNTSELTSILYSFTSYPSKNSSNHNSCDYGDKVIHLLTVLYSLIIVVGLIGNALVVWVITVGTQLKSTTDVCLLNLALADLLLVLSLPFQIYRMNHRWIFVKTMCTMIYGMYYFGFYGSILFIVLMSIDRYLAIVHAVFALRVRTKTHGIVSSLVIWILAVAASFPELLGDKQSTEFVCVPYSYDLSLVIIFKMNIVCLLVPLIIVGFCYSMIPWRLHRCRSPKKHSIRLIVLVMVVYFCCWTPYNITTFLVALLFKGVIPASCEFLKQISLMIKLTIVMAYSHTCLNPFLYVFVGEKFRKHLISLIRERRPICCSLRVT